MISHLLFADDSLFFIGANRSNNNQLMKIFKDYEEVSGQLINLQKSSITFGNKVFHHKREMIKAILQISKIGGRGKYLGLPEQFGRKKKKYSNIFRKV